MNAKIMRVLQWSSDTKTFYICPERPFTFIPGQFVMLGLNVSGTFEKRAYSLCNNPEDETLEVTIKVYVPGKLSPELFKLKEGDELFLDGPFGNFRLDMNDKKAVLIAGGTGIAPLMSMIRLNHRCDDALQLTVLYSASDSSRLIYLEELESLALAKKITFLPIVQQTISLPSGFFCGKINQTFIEKHVKDLDQTFYLCGSPSMIRDIETALRALGVEKQRIKTDKWG